MEWIIITHDKLKATIFSEIALELLKKNNWQFVYIWLAFQ